MSHKINTTGTLIHVFPEGDGYIVQVSHREKFGPRKIMSEEFCEDRPSGYAAGRAARLEHPSATFWFNPKGERLVS